MQINLDHVVKAITLKLQSTLNGHNCDERSDKATQD